MNVKTYSVFGLMLIFSTGSLATNLPGVQQNSTLTKKISSLPELAEQTLLPSPFPVYLLDGGGLVNYPYPETTKVLLITNNDYEKVPGCYLACYSYSKGAYSVGSSINVMGQIRVPGSYHDRLCIPQGYAQKDIAAEEFFKTLCSQKIPACFHNDCWAGGDTGGWFGIQ